MHLTSINVAQPTEMPGTARGTVVSAIRKLPVSVSVMVRSTNVAGDAQGDLTVHGGPDQAVYVYATEDYTYWREQLGWEMPNYGWFGENFTVEGAESDVVSLGDVWQVGEALFQVTSPRVPCFKLDHKMGIRGFAARFARSGRVGFFLRVLREGAVEAGAVVRVVDRDPNDVTVTAVSNMRHYREGTLEDAERVLAIESLPGQWEPFAQKIIKRAGVQT
jgi:MOSC domain-containing protein YiiM